MIRYETGNLLEAPVEALVNTVNEVGVLGKGLALMFRDAFPASARMYERACASGEVHVGRMFVTQNEALHGPRLIIHFPTKKHWRHPSQLAWIREGLLDLARVIKEESIRSIALPPLGCGNGHLEWEDVRPEIETILASLNDVDILVFAPSDKYWAPGKVFGTHKLTPARAMVAEGIRRYSVLGFECSILEVQKVAWFLQRAVISLGLPDSLKLDFDANKYGPYSDKLRHVLDALDGSYLHCAHRIADAGPLEPIWFEPAKREQMREYFAVDPARPYLAALDKVSEVIDGFESPLGMELLATVDWLTRDARDEASLVSVKEGLANWPGGRSSSERKLRIFDDRLIGLALNRLATVQL
jgi:O-acetyl-ADP-ribose deacetylase (regulator of RNase III)